MTAWTRQVAICKLLQNCWCWVAVK